MNLLLYGDCPDSHAGLSRILRDLCIIAGTMPELRVGSFGRGAVGSTRFPWPQYSFCEADQWGEHKIAKVWRDFTRGTGEGSILTVWDASRLLWFTGLARTGSDELDQFVGPQRTFSKWGYFMIDATGPDGQTLPAEQQAVLKSYDRVVVASDWAAQVARRSGIDCEWIPHPIDGDKFKFSPTRQIMRENFQVDDKIVLGCVMTNQARKDWPTAFAVASMLAKQYKSKFLFWVHTDYAFGAPGTYWNLHALAADYGLTPENLRITNTGTYTDWMMAAFYNSCDATMLVSGGEGFGYTIAESLACGCPCITQDYAAGAELTQEDWRVPVNAFRLETSHNVLRAVHSPYIWAKKVSEAIEKTRIEGEEYRQEIAESMKHLHIRNLKTVWKRWFLEGLR